MLNNNIKKSASKERAIEQNKRIKRNKVLYIL